MSTYSQLTKHPITKIYENALWLDDYFGHYHYGVQFPSEPHKIYDARDYKWEFLDELYDPTNFRNRRLRERQRQNRPWKNGF